MIWRWLASVIGVLLLAAAALVVVLTMTESGSAWVAQEVEALSAGAVQLDGVGGTLRGGLTVTSLRVQAGDITVEAGDLGLQISARNLLGGRLVVRSLVAARVSVVLTGPPRPPSQPLVVPALTAPLPVIVEELRIGRLEVQAGDEPVQIERVALAAAWTGQDFVVQRFGAALGPFALGVSGRATLGPGLPLDAEVAWRLREPLLTGAGRIRGDLDRLQFEQRLQVPGEVTVAGTLVDIAGARRVEAVATWEEVHHDLAAVGVVRSTAGRLELAGDITDWQATLVAGLEVAPWPAARVEARARGDSSRLVFERLRVEGDFGSAIARGVLAFEPAVRLRLEAVVPRLRTAALREGLDGELAARLRLDAVAGGAARLEIRELRGRLMDRPLAGEGDLRFADGTLAFDRVRLQAGPNRLRADGAVGARLAGRFDLVAPELGVLWPGLGGALDARATLAGTRAQPVVDLVATGRALELDGTALARLDLRLRTDRRGRADAMLAVRELRLGSQDLGDLDVVLDGTLREHRLGIVLDGPALGLRTESRGRWDGRALQHRLAAATLRHEVAGTWSLAGEPPVSLGTDSASIGPHCWLQDPTALCIDAARWSPRRSQLAARLDDFDLQRFDPWLPADLAVTGRADASLDLTLDGDMPVGSVTWRQRGTTLYYTGGDEPVVTPLDTVEIAADATAGGATGRLTITGGEGLRLQASGHMEGAPGVDAALEARVQGAWPDIAPLLPLFAPDVELADVAGGLTLDATVGGSLREPRLAGTMRFADGAVALPAIGVKLEAIDIALTGDGSDAFRLQGTARAGGPLTLDGELRPLGSDGPQARVRVRGERLDAVRLTDRYVQASPDFTLSWSDGRLGVEGGILIPRAEIIVRAVPQTAVSPSADVVVMDREAAAVAPPSGPVLGGELALTLGRDVRLKGFGLDTLVEGTVKLSQGADGEPRAFGVLRLREGKFGAYGKELTIDRGTIGFSGPLDDPAVNLRASRRVDWEGKSVTAGILLAGTVSRPETRVFSEPAMSEADAISYLVSGRPMQSADASDRSAIAGAALSLGVAQTAPLTQKLGSAVTLDELGIEGGSLDETEVVAGKQLNDDLYVRFTYGLFNRIGTVLARYRIGRGLSIEAASGEDQSLDLVYSVERD